jgi:hypothetical protein
VAQLRPFQNLTNRILSIQKVAQLRPFQNLTNRILSIQKVAQLRPFQNLTNHIFEYPKSGTVATVLKWHCITGKSGTVSPEKVAQLRPVYPIKPKS